MTKGKNYNRIVFLTTLSLYLGLVLVGGTPQVLAYAALTRTFDIQNEIEVKDDLDTKPDNEEIEISPKADFPGIFAELLNEISHGVESEKIRLPKSFHYSGEFRQFSDGSGSGTGAEHNNHLDFLVEDAIHQKLQPKALELADYDGDSKSVKISIAGTASELSLNVSFSKSRADHFTEFLNREFSSAAISAENKSLKQVYENTKVTSLNNQIFIVTRLPRAGIDSHLE